MKTLKILGILIGAGAGLVIALKIKKIIPLISSKLKELNRLDSVPDKTLVKGQDSQGILPPGYSSGIDEIAAKDEFLRNADSFSQLYETLYQVVNGTSINPNDAINEWDTRINYLNNSPNVRQIWNSLFSDISNLNDDQLKEKTKSFLDFILSAGIKRDNNDSVIVDGSTIFKYYTLNGEALVTGEKMKIISPCWSANNKIIEKGILKKYE